MISDLLGSTTAVTLKGTHPLFERAFEWIEKMPVDHPDGRIDLGGDDFYVNVHGYSTRSIDRCAWESHRETIDIQYCISGAEIIEWASPGALKASSDYSPLPDVEHWHGDVDANRVRLVPGMFVVFLPNELHRPQLEDRSADAIRKLVVKIRSRLLNL